MKPLIVCELDSTLQILHKKRKKNVRLNFHRILFLRSNLDAASENLTDDKLNEMKKLQITKYNLPLYIGWVGSGSDCHFHEVQSKPQHSLYISTFKGIHGTRSQFSLDDVISTFFVLKIREKS